MKKEFLGLSDDGYRMYKMWTPGEKGDCGIVMIVGYRDKDFMVYESEAWDDEVLQARERTAQHSADNMRSMMDLVYRTSNRVNSKGIPVVTARSVGKSSIAEMAYVDFAALEAKALVNIGAPEFLFDDTHKIKPPALKPEQQGQPKRKSQPNRGPLGRKDWK